ncbi:Chromatin assembly factor 1 subunit p50 [Spathaspora sp. JA1]|nr:Chromatin assembly factor 1 subunit p50 [Spathaspora sp. JA1]
MSVEIIDIDQEPGYAPEPVTTSIDETTQRGYRIWKKNAPFIYDYLSTNSLLWPSLSVQFFPDITHSSQEEEETISQRLLHGSFTLGQSVDSISILQIPSFTNLNSNIKINKLDFNPDKEELEFSPSNNRAKLKVLQKINHLGDVNKVRYMPQKPDILASANNLGDVVIYDRTKHKSFNNSLIDDTDISKVEIRLSNSVMSCSSDIFALDWNLNHQGLLLSGDMQGIVNLYDLKKYSNNALNQCRYFENENVGINDIQWLPAHDSLFGAVDDQGSVKIYDTRENNPVVVSVQISSHGVDSISFNPGFSSGFATGDSQGIIKIWDLRSLTQQQTQPVQELTNVHTDSITQLSWHPKFHNVLASSSSDHSVKLHDVAESTCFFSHLGHMLGVNDFDWSYADDWMIASVADDNSLHVWKPSHTVTDRFKTR